MDATYDNNKINDLSQKERLMWLQKAKEAFGKKNFREARDYFVKAGHRQGLIDIGDYYMYQRELPLAAYTYYKLAGEKERVDEIRCRMFHALSYWLGDKKRIQDSMGQLQRLYDEKKAFQSQPTRGAPVDPRSRMQVQQGKSPKSPMEIPARTPVSSQKRSIPIPVSKQLREKVEEILRKKQG